MSKAAVAREKTGRNEPCPCGSGRKAKHCCLDPNSDKNRRRRRTHSLIVLGILLLGGLVWLVTGQWLAAVVGLVLAGILVGLERAPSAVRTVEAADAGKADKDPPGA